MAPAGSFTPGGSVGREGDGMIDLLGDSRMLAGQNRTAGFDDAGNFLGLSAFTEDLGYEQQSRRRERDLADVERLAGRYKDVMDQFKDEGLMTEVGEVGGSQDVFLRDITGQTGSLVQQELGQQEQQVQREQRGQQILFVFES